MLEVKKIRFSDSSIEYYISPWDSSSFGYNVMNVIPETMVIQHLDHLDELIVLLEKCACNEDVKIIVWRISAQKIDISLKIQEYKYYFIEMSVVPYINPQKVDEKVYNDYCNHHVRKAKVDDLEAMKNIAGNAFKNDRFHKDPFFDNDKADFRYMKWVENSIFDNEDIFVVEYEKEISGFFIIKIDVESNYAAMRLGCISEEYQGLKMGYSINAYIVLMLKKLGISQMDSPIAISNVGIFNLYVSMGFRFKDHKLCFHKLIK